MIKKVRKILHIKVGSMENSVLKRNTLEWVLNLHLDGYFEKVFILFFKCDVDRKYQLSDKVIAYDVCGFRGLKRIKLINAFLSELVFLLRTSFLIKKEKISVILADNPFLMGINAFLLSRLCGLPYVIHILADFDLYYDIAKTRNMPFVSRKIEKIIERFLFRHADMVIADRQYYLDYALKNGAKVEKSYRFRTIADKFYYTATPQRDADIKEQLCLKGYKILFYFGRLHKEKMVDHLILCLQIVLQKYENSILLLAGSGPHESEFKDLAEHLGIADHVFFLGNKNAQELVNIMASTDVLLASHAGFSLIEMALSGKPIVAYDYEWHPEFIKDKENGLLVEFKNYRGLAKAVIQILDDPGLGASLGKKARERALTFHQPKDAIHEERKCYQILFNTSEGEKTCLC